jgi:hypothetical protein
MQTSISVVKKEIIKLIEHVEKVEISLISLILGSHAEFNVLFMNADQKPFKHHRVKIDGANYQAWMNDDTYVVDFILNHLELVKSDL